MTLKPQFLYAIFGETEKIFGFKGLSINLTLAADSLLTLLEVSYAERIPAHLNVESEDVIGTLLEFLPPDTFLTRSEWLQAAKRSHMSFMPQGDLKHSYTRNGQTFKIFKSSLADTSFTKVFGRMQIFSLVYIEGASLIDSSDDRFDVWTLYRDNKGCYDFVGYSTCYRYNFFDKIQHSLEAIRYRVSQFAILPNHQSQGHGGHLYDAIYRYCQEDAKIAEMTVEDPSEAFDDLRDRRDLAKLSQLHVFDDEACTTLPSKDWIRRTQQTHKIAPRQFIRLLEMSFLTKLDKRDKTAEQALKMMIKARLFKKNKFVLAELEPSERLAKLEETYQSQVSDYHRLLSGLLVTNGVYADGNEDDDRQKKRVKHV